MISETTAARIDHGLASLALDQLRGTAPPPGQVSTAEIARRAGVSEATVAKLQMIALAKLARHLTADPELAPLISRYLSNPKTNPTN